MPEDAFSSPSPSDQRRNFSLGVANGALFRTGMVFIDPDVVMTWFLAQLGVANLLIGLVSPIRMGSAFVLQIPVSGYLQRKPFQLPFYRWVSIFRCAFLLCLALVVALIPVGSPWLVVLFFVFLVLFSMGSGLIGLPFMDMVGKVIPATRRGAFFSQRLFWGGLFGLGSSYVVGVLLSERNGLPFPNNVALLFGFAFAFYVVTAFVWNLIKEPAGVVDADQVRWTQQFRRGGRLVRTDAGYRTYLLVGLLWRLAQAAAPFYIVYATTVMGIPAGMIGLYLAARTASSILSNLLWGRVSDRRGNRLLIQIAMLVGLSMPVTALLIGALVNQMPQYIPAFSYAYTIVFVGSGAFGASTMIGNTGYLLGIAPPEQRPLYIGFASTVLGLAFFVTFLGGVLVDWGGFTLLLMFAAGFYLLALLLSFKMVEPRASEIRPAASQVPVAVLTQK